MLVPRLVTGVKHWHLRQDSDFYPRVNFLSALKSIPEGAEVIFIIGEIDCREGILLAVERDKYKTVVDGMKHTVGIFMSVLAGIISTKKITALIHPVLPMLKETRPIVIAYNQVYQTILQQKFGTSSCARWLDFFDDLILINEDGVGTLKEGLIMDGTHITPGYVKSHLEVALNKLSI